MYKNTFKYVNIFMYVYIYLNKCTTCKCTANFQKHIQSIYIWYRDICVYKHHKYSKQKMNIYIYIYISICIPTHIPLPSTMTLVFSKELAKLALKIQLPSCWSAARMARENTLNLGQRGTGVRSLMFNLKWTDDDLWDNEYSNDIW